LFDWDDANISHIEDHDVEPEEAEEALTDPRRIPGTSYNVPGERRRAVIGATVSGRVLFVVYTRRRDRIRVITARDADRHERRAYRFGKR